MLYTINVKGEKVLLKKQIRCTEENLVTIMDMFIMSLENGTLKEMSCGVNEKMRKFIELNGLENKVKCPKQLPIERIKMELKDDSLEKNESII
jgi:hypothetical protein